MPIRRHPKQVEFGEKGQVVVAGSDHGVVYVFDRMTGSKLAELKAAERGMVQTVTVCSPNWIHLLQALNQLRRYRHIAVGESTRLWLPP